MVGLSGVSDQSESILLQNSSVVPANDGPNGAGRAGARLCWIRTRGTGRAAPNPERALRSHVASGLRLSPLLTSGKLDKDPMPFRHASAKHQNADNRH